MNKCVQLIAVPRSSVLLLQNILSHCIHFPNALNIGLIQTISHYNSTLLKFLASFFSFFYPLFWFYITVFSFSFAKYNLVATIIIIVIIVVIIISKETT